MKLFSGNKDKSDYGRNKDKNRNKYNDDDDESRRSGHRRDEKRNRMKDRDRSRSRYYSEKDGSDTRSSNSASNKYEDKRRDRRIEEGGEESLSEYRRRSSSLESKRSRNGRGEGRKRRDNDEISLSGSSRKSRYPKDQPKDQKRDRLDDYRRKEKNEMALAAPRDRRRSKSLCLRRIKEGSNYPSRDKDDEHSKRSKSRYRRRSSSIRSKSRRANDGDAYSTRSDSRVKSRSKSIARLDSKEGKKRRDNDEISLSGSSRKSRYPKDQPKDQKRDRLDDYRRKEKHEMALAAPRDRRRSKSLCLRRTKEGSNYPSGNKNDEHSKRSTSRYRRRSSSIRSKSRRANDGDAYSTRSDSRVKSRSKSIAKSRLGNENDAYSARLDSRVELRSQPKPYVPRSIDYSKDGSRTDEYGSPTYNRHKRLSLSPDSSRRSTVQTYERNGRHGDHDDTTSISEIASDGRRREERLRGGHRSRESADRQHNEQHAWESPPYIEDEYDHREVIKELPDVYLASSQHAVKGKGTNCKYATDAHYTGGGSSANNVELLSSQLQTDWRRGIPNDPNQALVQSLQYGMESSTIDISNSSHHNYQSAIVNSAPQYREQYTAIPATWRCNSCSNVNDKSRQICANCEVPVKTATQAHTNPAQVREMNHFAVHQSKMQTLNSPSQSSPRDTEQSHCNQQLTRSLGKGNSTSWRCDSCGNTNKQIRLCMNCGATQVPSKNGVCNGNVSSKDQRREGALQMNTIDEIDGHIKELHRRKNEEKIQKCDRSQAKGHPSNQINDRLPHHSQTSHGHKAVGTTILTVRSKSSPREISGSASRSPSRNQGKTIASAMDSWMCLDCHSEKMNYGPFCASCGTKSIVISKQAPPKQMQPPGRIPPRVSPTRQSVEVNYPPRKQISWNCKQCKYANDKQRECCEYCGANPMHKLQESPGATLQPQISRRCSACGNNNRGQNKCQCCRDQVFNNRIESQVSDPVAKVQPSSWRCACNHVNGIRRPFCEHCGAKKITLRHPRESTASKSAGPIPQCSLSNSILSEIKETKEKSQTSRNISGLNVLKRVPNRVQNPSQHVHTQDGQQQGKALPIHHKQRQSYGESHQAVSSPPCESKSIMMSSQYDVSLPPNHASSNRIPQSTGRPMVLADIKSGNVSLKSLKIPKAAERTTGKVSNLSEIKTGRDLKSVEKRKVLEAPSERPVSIFDQIKSGPQLKKVKKMKTSSIIVEKSAPSSALVGILARRKLMGVPKQDDSSRSGSDSDGWD
eukprot:scaffold1377_cov231-Chaetoceros_neogracile.AAC.11